MIKRYFVPIQTRRGLCRPSILAAFALSCILFVSDMSWREGAAHAHHSEAQQ